MRVQPPQKGGSRSVPCFELFFAPARDARFIFAGMRLKYVCALAGILLFFAGCREKEADEDLHVQYRKLKQYLQGYREIRDEGGWPVIKAKGVLMAGVKDKEVEVLRDRLAVTGELKNKYSNTHNSEFDDEVKKAVVKFQKNHGLQPSGVVDKRTLFELNIPVEYRILQIEKNMERWRSFRSKDDKDFILVNIADYSLEAVENDSARLQMSVIVGKLYRKTPTFSEKMTQVEFNPKWHVPPTILKEDMIPKIQADTGYLRKNNLKVFQKNEAVDASKVNWNEVSSNADYSLVRDADAQNPLGVVKFLFPNKYSVYMHDTPQKDLFKKKNLFASSGCIRLAKAVELAHYVMARDKGWSASKVDSIISTGNTRRFNLDKPLMVHIQYFTSWVDKSGDLQFRRDIYGRDVRIEKQEKEADKKQTDKNAADW